MNGEHPRADAMNELQRAGIAIKTLRARLQAYEQRSSEPVAVVGMSGRFPGATSVPAFWELLAEGRDAVEDVPAERWDKAAYFDPEPGKPGKMYTSAGGFLRDLELFDAAFFNVTALEAQVMEPQQRLLLESSWEALEDAGEVRERLLGAPVGVFVGITAGDYGMRVRDEAGPEYLDAHYLAGNPLNFAAGRLAYTFGFTGPCLAVDTACSSSLVALHLAVRSLRSGECEMALAAGVNVILCPESTAMLCRASLISPSGRCRTFDASADGMVRGEGCGVVVLKRLSDALRDGNHIHAVIRGTAVNQDGASSSLSAPNGRAQEAVIRAALSDGRVKAEEVAYVEAHGSATPLGDPTEVRALSAVYGSARGSGSPLLIGSVKTNIGHLESAAGMAGLFKVIQGLSQERLVRQLHFSKPNPEVDWARANVVVCAEDRAWPRGERARYAAVSGFGASGTNAHIVVEEAPTAPHSEAGRSGHALVLSAPTASGLETMTQRLVEHLESHPEQSFSDVAYTLQVGRAAFAFRRAVVCKGREDAIQALCSLDPARVSTRQVTRGRQRPMLFLCPGSQEHDLTLGSALYDEEPVFRDELERSASLLRAEFGVELLDLLRGRPRPDLDRDWQGRVAAFAVQQALGRTLMSWGLKPQLLIGRGVGEYVAASLASVMTAEDALRLAARRPGGRAPAVTLRAPELALISRVSGERMTALDAQEPAYWLDCSESDVPGTDTRIAVTGEPLWVSLGRAARSQRASLVTSGEQDILEVLGTRVGDRTEAEALQHLLAVAWLEGTSIQWPQVYAGRAPRRVRLPTYAFERQRYWIDLPGKHRRAPSSEASESKLPLERWFTTPTWKQQNVGPAPSSESIRARKWLVFTTPAATGLGTVAALQAHGVAPVRVVPGNVFAEVEPGLFTVRPDRAEDYAALIETVRRTLGEPDAVVYEWSVAPLREALSASSVDAATESAFFGVVSLTSALAALGRESVRRLCVITNNVHAVTGADVAAPEQALALGPCAVIPQEHPNISCVAVDVDLRQPPAELALVGGRIVQEACRATTERNVAYRERSRFIRTYDPLARELPDAALREGGVYLITGGLGGVGLALASELALKYRARVALLGRRELPPRETWESYLEAASPDVSKDTFAVLERLLALEAAGGEVMVLRADVADVESLRRALDAVRSRFGAIHGVIHAAGLPGAGLIATKTRADADRVFAPKVRGTLALSEALNGERLDFLALCSSSIGVFGGVGQSDYAAANAFLDAYAHYERARGRPVVSIGWDLWEIDNWQSELLKSLPALLGQMKEQRARYGIRGEEGLRVLEALHGAECPHVVVATRPFEALYRMTAETTVDGVLARATQRGRSLRERPELTVPYVGPRNAVEESLGKIWAAVFEYTRVGAEDNYFDLGGDSLNGLQVVAQVRQSFGVEISLHDLFAHPTLTDLALLIEERIVQSLETSPQEP